MEGREGGDPAPAFMRDAAGLGPQQHDGRAARTQSCGDAASSCLSEVGAGRAGRSVAAGLGVPDALLDGPKQGENFPSILLGR